MHFSAHPWVFRASDGFQLLANLSEVYFPEVGEYEEDGYPLYKRVHVTAPGEITSSESSMFDLIMFFDSITRMFCVFLVYSLQEYCTRMIRKMVRKEDVNKLEIPAYLKKEISRQPNLRRDLKVLAARRAANGS